MKKLLQYLLILTLFTPLFLDLHFFQPYVTGQYFFFFLFILLTLPLVLYFLAQTKNLWQNKYFLVLVSWFVLQFVLALFSVDYNRSFWGDWQRMDGLFYYWPFLIFFIAILMAFKYKTAWQKLFFTQQLIFLATIIWAWGQKFSFWFMADDQAGRVYALIGNANFLAHYLLLAFYLSLFLFVSEHKYRYLHLAVAVFSVPIIYWTQSRGAWLALFVSLLFLALWQICQFIKTKNWRALKIASILVIFSFLSLYFISDQRHRRVTLDDATVETRLVAWDAAYQGFLDKPMLGWGRNNFQIVFNKYLDNKIYTGPGTPMWFDKAHNQYLDYLVETGMLGLIIYLLFLAWPFLLVKKIYPHNNKVIFLSAGLVANLIFLFFNFDTQAAYILYFIYLAYLYYLAFGKDLEQVKIKKSLQIKFYVFGIIVTIFLGYHLAYLPLRANIFTKQVQVEKRSSSELISKAQKAMFFAPQHISDINFAVATAASSHNWLLEDKRQILDYLADLSTQNSQKHVLDAKSHFLTANTYLEFGALSVNKDLVNKALAYYQDIMPRLTLGDRPDVQEKIKQAQQILNLLENN